MKSQDRAFALYGRFSPGARERLTQGVVAGGGTVARDLTRRSDVLVVGGAAEALVDSGALSTRLAAARSRKLPVLGERAFAALLAGEAPPDPATLPLSTALSGSALSRDDAEVLAAFDLIRIEGDNVRFADAGVVRSAGELAAAGRSLGEAVRILARARDLAPRGRHKIVLMAGGAALQWEDGLTSLEGQGLLPLDEANATVEDLFEGASLAEADGDLEAAARLYDLCARADRSDAIAPFNLGNVRLAEQAYDQAALSYQQALNRDPRFGEARYNLAQALEAAGKLDAAAVELGRLIAQEPAHSDAVFNLAQLTLKAGDMVAAKALYERYLALGPPDDWAQTARKAITYCAAHLTA